MKAFGKRTRIQHHQQRTGLIYVWRRSKNNLEGQNHDGLMGIDERGTRARRLDVFSGATLLSTTLLARGLKLNSLILFSEVHICELAQIA